MQEKLKILVFEKDHYFKAALLKLSDSRHTEFCMFLDYLLVSETLHIGNRGLIIEKIICGKSIQFIIN